MTRKKDNIVYKEQLTHFLLSILGIAASDVENSNDFDIAYQKRLKFQKTTDWKKYRACVDLIDDTEYAIHSGFQYQLGSLSKKKKDFGEKYIRLYGILNAVYLQMNAIIGLANLINFPKREEIKPHFENLDIYKLRGMTASHTSDYMYDKKTLEQLPKIHQTTSFRIAQMYLEETGSKIVVLDENNIEFDFNLLKVLTEYEKIATDYIIRLIKHSVAKLIYSKEIRTEILSN